MSEPDEGKAVKIIIHEVFVKEPPGWFRKVGNGAWESVSLAAFHGMLPVVWLEDDFGISRRETWTDPRVLSEAKGDEGKIVACPKCGWTTALAKFMGDEGRAEKALRQLIDWLEDDTLPLMRVGDFDAADRQLLRDQIEKARVALSGEGEKGQPELSATRYWLDTFGESARGSVSWEFACSFAEQFAEAARSLPSVPAQPINESSFGREAREHAEEIKRRAAELCWHCNCPRAEHFIGSDGDDVRNCQNADRCGCTRPSHIPLPWLTSSSVPAQPTSFNQSAWDQLRLELVSWGGQAYGYLHVCDSKAAKDIAAHLDAALERLIHCDFTAVEQTGSSSSVPPHDGKLFQHVRDAEQWMRQNKGLLPGPLTDSDWEQIRGLLVAYEKHILAGVPSTQPSQKRLSKQCEDCAKQIDAACTLSGEFRTTEIADLIYKYMRDLFHEVTEVPSTQPAPPTDRTLQCVREEWQQREVDFVHGCVRLPFHVAESLDKLLDEPAPGAAKGEE